jgi:hypothetical protein
MYILFFYNLDHKYISNNFIYSTENVYLPEKFTYVGLPNK